MTEYVCPTCGRVFNARRGLGVHHSSVHDERLPNRTCDACGTEFYSDSAKKYCSDECHDNAVSYAGESNPNYRGGKTKTNCELCDSEFEYYPSEKKGLYCSECVETAEWRPSPSIEGENNPRWNGGKLDLDCEVCGTSFERHPGNVTSEVTLCSEPCRAEWLSDSFTGEGHPNWKGGGNQDYGPGWNEIRRKALERDGYQCVICETTKEELGRNPDVHHIFPIRVFRESDDLSVADAHFLENVVSLCIGCHRRAEFGNIPKAKLRAAIHSKSASRESPLEIANGRT